MSLPLVVGHPLASVSYLQNMAAWQKWRLTYEGGDSFIDTYLRKLTKRETDDDFSDRKALTYCPAFSKQAVNEIRDAIYQRMCDISRKGGPKNYEHAVAGLDGGVDLEGSSMNYFMGIKALPELLVMKNVGIYVDKPSLPVNASREISQKYRPYLYSYRTEEVINWIPDLSSSNNDYLAILLQESYDCYDPITGFPVDTSTRYRRMWKDINGQVYVCFHKNHKMDEMYDEVGNRIDEPIKLPIPKIPFVLLDISESLMTDICGHQIALLNLASTDMSYCVRSNYPFYVEERGNGPENGGFSTGPNKDDAQDKSAKTKEISTGPSRGRYYPYGTKTPSFISPSPEPMQVSMDKQEQLKAEIRQLCRLAVSNLKGPRLASAESKKEDNRTLDSGLSYIGMELQRAEQKIAEFWNMYEQESEAPTVIYPINYSLKTDADRREEIKHLDELRDITPSTTLQKVITKRIAEITVGNKVARETFETIEKEIENATVMRVDAETLRSDVEAGFVSLATASKLRGYAEGESEQAKEDHAQRLARIAAAQAINSDEDSDPGARGIKDLSANPNAGKEERAKANDTTDKETSTNLQRGDGK